MIKLKILVLEKDGSIKETERTFDNWVKANYWIARFLNLYFGDPFERVIRILDGKRIVAEYDTVTERFMVQI